MKLTDKEIIEALKAGRQIKDSDGFVYELSQRGFVCNVRTGDVLAQSIAALKRHFEIVEPEIDWDKVIREKCLCKFWDEDEEPAVQECRVAFLEKYTKHRYAPFRNHYGAAYQNCRPLRADEVKLVNDEKELWK